MSPADLATAAEMLVRRSTSAQRLPHHVTDRSTLTRVASLLTPNAAVPRARRPGYCKGLSSAAQLEEVFSDKL